VSDPHSRAADVLARQTRLLEQRLYAALLEGAPAAGVVEALRGYQNEDGRFGYGLEPDKRCPASQPLDVQVALETLYAAGTRDPAMLQRACDYLAAVGSDGGVPCVLPSIAAYPPAAHWGDGEFPPGLNPTAAIVGLLYALGVDHPWLERRRPNSAGASSSVSCRVTRTGSRSRSASSSTFRIAGAPRRSPAPSPRSFRTRICTSPTPTPRATA
jgi:hypothetical protein